MIHFVLAVRDRGADFFARPMIVPHVVYAIRAFTEEINDAKSQISRSPEDYDLYQMGTFDDSTGLFDCGVPKQIAVGKDLVRKA